MTFALFLACFSSCSKNCVCTATQNDQLLDEVVFDNISGEECEAKVDEAMHKVIEDYPGSSIVGLSISCSHL